jgi:hypothetical protein
MGVAVLASLAVSDVAAKWVEQRSKEAPGPAKRACVSYAKSCLHVMQLGHLVEGDVDDSYETLVIKGDGDVDKGYIYKTSPKAKKGRAG